MTSSKVSGIVQIDGTPARRIVRAFGYESTVHDINGVTVNQSMSLGHATSAPDTGEYTINLLGGYDRPVFVVAFDDYGVGFSPDMAVSVGDRVHPSTPNGYVWECVGEGTLPSEEPVWVIDTETAQIYGTASMIARPFYRPMVHGPIDPYVEHPTPHEWTPAELNLSLWYDPSDDSNLIYGTSGGVESITDLSGNGRDAAQTSASNQPTIGAINGVQALVFDSNKYIKASPWDSGTSHTLIAVAIPTNSGRIKSIMVSGGDGPDRNILQICFRTFIERIGFYDGVAWRDSSATATASPQILVWILDGVSGKATIIKDGEIISDNITYSPQYIHQSYPVYIGGRPGFWNDAVIGEVIKTDGVISEEDRKKLEGYLAHKWGLTLPSGHPYKDEPPTIEDNSEAG